MPAPTLRPYSRYSLDAVRLLGQQIRLARIEQRVPAAELAARAGISRNLLLRIERGDPGCGIGAVFEAAAIIGVPLFETDRDALSDRLGETERRLVLMPRAARQTRGVVRDDF